MASKLLKSYIFVNRIPRRFKSSHNAIAYNTALDAIAPTELSVSSNNLKVASQTLDLDTTTVGIFFHAGSRFEDSKTHGAANLVSNLLFKGTTKRAAADLESEVAKIGAKLHSETSKEITAVYGTCLNKDVPKLVEILSDVVLNAKFSDSDVDQIRKEILREHADIEQNLKEVTLDHLHGAAFLGTPLAQNRLGPIKNIETLKGSDLKYYADTHFKASRTVLAAAGGVDHRELLALGEQHLGKLDDNFDGSPIVLSKCRYTGSELRVRDDSIPVAHIALAVEGAAFDSPDRLALDIATASLGKWHRSEGRNEDTLDVLNYEAFNFNYTGTGLFGVYGVVDNQMKCNEFADTIIYNWHRLSRQVTDAELEAAKNRLANWVLARTEGSQGNCIEIGKSVVTLGQRVSIRDYIEAIKKTSNETIRETIDKYTHNKCLVVSSVGKNENLEDYLQYRNKMWKWF